MIVKRRHLPQLRLRPVAKPSSSMGMGVILIALITGAIGFGIGRWSATNNTNDSGVTPSVAAQPNRAQQQRRYIVPGYSVEQLQEQQNRFYEQNRPRSEHEYIGPGAENTMR
ncbi:MAG: hypothetical protein WCT04_07560 [Planctomycetota bacterium]